MVTKLQGVKPFGLVAKDYDPSVNVSSLRKIIVLIRTKVDSKSLATGVNEVSPASFMVGFVASLSLSFLDYEMVISSTVGVSDDVDATVYDLSRISSGSGAIKVVFYIGLLEAF